MKYMIFEILLFTLSKLMLAEHTAIRSIIKYDRPKFAFNNSENLIE